MNAWNVSAVVDVPPGVTETLSVPVQVDCRCVRFVAEHLTFADAEHDGATCELFVDAQPVTVGETPLALFHVDAHDALGAPRRLRHGESVRLVVEAGTMHLRLRLRLIVLPDHQNP